MNLRRRELQRYCWFGYWAAISAMAFTFLHDSRAYCERIVAVGVRNEKGQPRQQLFYRGLKSSDTSWVTGEVVQEGQQVGEFLRDGTAVEKAVRNRWSLAFRQGKAYDSRTSSVLTIERIEEAVRNAGWRPTESSPNLLINETAVAPEKQWIAFSHARLPADAWDLWVFNAAEERFTRISAGNNYDEMQRWSPDGTRLAFFRTPSHVGHGWGTGETTHVAYALWLWDRRSGESKQIAPPGTYADFGRQPPVWSPDGSTILYQTANTMWKEQLAPHIVDANGGAPRRLLPATEQWRAAASEYSFSPDGKRILFLQKGCVCIVGSDGSNPSVILSDRKYSRCQWNTDGTLVFLGTYVPDWFMAQSDGSAITLISPPEGYRIFQIAAFPD